MREFFDSVRQIVDFIHRAFRFHDLEVEQRVDLRLHIVFSNHILLVEIIHLFTKVDGVGVEISAVGVSHGGFWAIDERDNHIDAWLQRGVILTQSLNNFGFGLRDNHQTLFHENEYEHD